MKRRKVKEEARDQLNALEKEEVRLVYPVGLTQTFSRQELGPLRKRFTQLIPAEDTSQELRIPLGNLLQMPELRMQPFVPLVARLILNRQTKDAMADGTSGELVSFDVFMTILSVFSVKQLLEFKRRVLFDIYDQENKGCIIVDDFLRVISEVSRPNAAQKKIICQELELHLAPFVKKSNGGVSGVLFSDFNKRLKQARIFNNLKRKKDEVDGQDKEHPSLKEAKEIAEMAKSKLANKKVVLKCTRNVLRCTNSRCKANFWNRDVNAARNVLELLKSGLKRTFGATQLRAFRKGL